MGKQVMMAAMVAVAAMTGGPWALAGQAPEGWSVPRTADGRPALQGIAQLAEASNFALKSLP